MLGERKFKEENMRIFRVGESSEEGLDMDKMEKWFEKRTKMHIDLVQKYAKIIEEQFPSKMSGLTDQASKHDASKYDSPEYEPYLYVSWKHKCKDNGVDFNVPNDIEKEMDEATGHHIKNNRHHPEFHSDKDISSGKKVNATKMTDVDVGEMVSDWLAMSEEKGTDPKEWADKNVNVKWEFSKDQEELIYEIIDKIWKS